MSDNISASIANVIESMWRGYAGQRGYKRRNASYMGYEREFVVGALSALSVVNPDAWTYQPWITSLMNDKIVIRDGAVDGFVFFRDEIDDATRIAIEGKWRLRAEAQKYVWGTHKYRQREHDFLYGARCALLATSRPNQCQAWTVSIGDAPVVSKQGPVANEKDTNITMSATPAEIPTPGDPDV